MKSAAGLAAWLMVAAALIVALLAAHVVEGSLRRSVQPVSGVVSTNARVIPLDECRSGADPGDPAWWPSCP
jgi:hypothetical protein